jgi:hypothetical protein
MRLERPFVFRPQGGAKVHMNFMAPLGNQTQRGHFQLVWQALWIEEPKNPFNFPWFTIRDVIQSSPGISQVLDNEMDVGPQKGFKLGLDFKQDCLSVFGNKQSVAGQKLRVL